MRWVLAAMLLVITAGPAVAADVHGAPLPRRARSLEDGRFASPLGFRATVDWYRKELRRRGANVELVGPIRYRGVVFVRVLPTDAATPWAAVHIVLADGRTTIYILAASSAGVSASKF